MYNAVKNGNNMDYNFKRFICCKSGEFKFIIVIFFIRHFYNRLIYKIF